MSLEQHLPTLYPWVVCMCRMSINLFFGVCAVLVDVPVSVSVSLSVPASLRGPSLSLCVCYRVCGGE